MAHPDRARCSGKGNDPRDRVMTKMVVEGYFIKG